MAASNPTKTVTNPRIAKLIELETAGRIKPEHQQELDSLRAQGMAPARPKLTEAEGKTTAFYNRALGADQDFENSGVADEPRSYLGQKVADFAPTLANQFASDGRQKAEQAKRDFIAASLRYESGAAISPQEFDKQDAIFFPQPGDGEGVLAQKRAARQRVIESFKVSSGSGAERVDQLRGPDSGPLVAASALPPETMGAVHLTIDQEAELKKLAQSGASPQAVIAAYKAYGLDLPQDQAEAGARFYRNPANRQVAPVVSVDNSVKPVDPGDGATGAFVRGAANTGSLGLLNRVGALADTVQGGTYAENLDRRRGYDAYDQANNGGARLAGEFAGGFALPIIGGEATAGNLARTGAAYGGFSGFNNSYGDVGDRLGSAGFSALAGAGLGYGLGRTGQALANRFPGGPPPGVNANVVNAAERQGVEIVRPDADPSRRSLYGFLESLPFSGGRVRADLQRGADQIEQRVADIGGGQAVPRVTAGETIRTGGERYVDRSRAVTSRLYDRAATLSGNARVTPNQALATLDGHISQLSETPSTNSTKLDVLNQIRSDLVDDAGNARPLSIQALRDIRTGARDELSAKGLRYTDTERRITDAIDSASQDIRGQLSGPALRAYDRADRAYRERADLVDNVIEKFIGNDRSNPRSGEAIMAAVENASQPRSGNAASLQRLTDRLDPAERTQVASTIAAQLGRRGADGDNAFTPNLFFSQIQKFSPEARAAIWGRQGAADLADLAAISEGRAATMGRLNNSRSGQVSNWLGAIKSVLSGNIAGGGVGLALGGAGGAATGAAGGAAVVPAGLAGAYVTARSFGSPRVVSALAQALRANTPSAQTRVVQQLGRIAAREPQIANDILPIQQSLQAALPRAAAEEQKQDRR